MKDVENQVVEEAAIDSTATASDSVAAPELTAEPAVEPVVESVVSTEPSTKDASALAADARKEKAFDQLLKLASEMEHRYETRRKILNAVFNLMTSR